jgi:hypothetical protein
MHWLQLWLGGICWALCAAWARAGEPQPAPPPPSPAYQALQAELNDIQLMLEASREAGESEAAAALRAARNDDPAVSTRAPKSKLKVSGLVKQFFYHIDDDESAWVDAQGVQNALGNPRSFPGYGHNGVADNDGFATAAALIEFTVDATDNVRAVLSLDAAQTDLSQPGFPTNQGQQAPGEGAVFADAGFSQGGHARNSAVRNGGHDPARLLRDAYVEFHGLAPGVGFIANHAIRVGQQQRRIGFEGWRGEDKLDFAVRSMIGQLASLRDVGVQVHGRWWNHRVQYWVGGFNGAGTAFQRRANRPDDNDEADLVTALLLRPVWQPLERGKPFGQLEVGGSYLYGLGGESGGPRPWQNPVPGLNQRNSSRYMLYAWLNYNAGGALRGLWLRGEWARVSDRFAPGELGGNRAPGVLDATHQFLSPNAQRFVADGWYASIGYRFDRGAAASDLGSLLKPLELAFRYERLENLFYPDPFVPDTALQIFNTDVATFGMHYRLRGDSLKFGLDYNLVMESDEHNGSGFGAGPPRRVREVRNNNLIASFQLAW